MEKILTLKCSHLKKDISVLSKLFLQLCGMFVPHKTIGTHLAVSINLLCRPQYRRGPFVLHRVRTSSTLLVPGQHGDDLTHGDADVSSTSVEAEVLLDVMFQDTF